MEVCSDPIPSKSTWDWGQAQVEAGQVLFLEIYFSAARFSLVYMECIIYQMIFMQDLDGRFIADQMIDAVDDASLSDSETDSPVIKFTAAEKQNE